MKNIFVLCLIFFSHNTFYVSFKKKKKNCANFPCLKDRAVYDESWPCLFFLHISTICHINTINCVFISLSHFLLNYYVLLIFIILLIYHTLIYSHIHKYIQ